MLARILLRLMLETKLCTIMNEALKAKQLPQISKYLKGKIADIGCGEHKVTDDAFGIDARKLPGVDFVTNNPYSLVEDIGLFDVVFSSHFLEHLANQYQAVLEWINCVGPGGYLILYLPDGRHYNHAKNREHMVDMYHENFVFWFKRSFCGEGLDYNGKALPKQMIFVESGMDVGDDRYSFYVIAKKPVDLQLEFPGVHGNTQVYMDCLRAICGDTAGKSMIDLCCCTAPHTPLLHFKDRMYVDILPRKLDWPEEQEFFLQQDVLEFEKAIVFDRSDVAICSDGIEHFSKENGYRLLHQMERIAHKQVLFTPLGEYLVVNSDDPEGHHSGWWPEDFKGYASIVFPEYHPTLGVGGFFVWKCRDIEQDFERVKEILMSKSWAIQP